MNHAFGEQVDEIGAEGNEQQKNKGQRGTGQGDAAGMKQITDGGQRKEQEKAIGRGCGAGERGLGTRHFFKGEKISAPKQIDDGIALEIAHARHAVVGIGGGLPGQRIDHAQTKRIKDQSGD